MPTVSEYVAPLHQVKGTAGDGIPGSDFSFALTYTGLVIDKADWAAAASFKDAPGGATVYECVTSLEDTSDDAGLATDVLKVTIERIPSTVTVDLYGTYYGSLVITDPAGELLTTVKMELIISGDS